MTVRLAAQVLGGTMAHIRNKFGPSHADETAEFILGIDKFFDCCNVRNTKECTIKGKPFLTPYKNQYDERFEWLKNDFLGYFENWKIILKIAQEISQKTTSVKCFCPDRHITTL